MSSSTRTPSGVDPRGPRVAAGLTSLVLVLVLVLPAPAAVVLLALQTVVFAIGATRGVGSTPYGWAFRTLVRPRLAPPSDLEDPRPLRFAQTVGLAFAVLGLLGYLAGLNVVGQVAVGLALTAALLNAALGLCLGCELYLTWRRVRPLHPTS